MAKIPLEEIDWSIPAIAPVIGKRCILRDGTETQAVVRRESLGIYIYAAQGAPLANSITYCIFDRNGRALGSAFSRHIHDCIAVMA